MNEEGKKLTLYTFTINNTCNSMMAYSLNLEELEGSTLSSKYIMTMVNDKDYVNMASLSSTDNYYTNSAESRVLATGSLGPNASINYSLRLWMDEATPMTTDAMNKSFRSKVVVVATPTKTVDFDYTGTEQAFVAPADGKYKIELWGAQGGNSGKSNLPGGLGAYTSGIISVSKGDIFYIEVDGQGQQNGRNISEAVANNNTYYQPASGGFNGTQGNAANAGGGSSFISGHNGCDAIKEESIENNIIHTGQSVHYSGLYFTDTVMIDGEEYK